MLEQLQRRIQSLGYIIDGGKYMKSMRYNNHTIEFTLDENEDIIVQLLQQQDLNNSDFTLIEEKTFKKIGNIIRYIHNIK